MLRVYLDKLLARKDLSAREMEDAFGIVTSGEVPHSQIGAFLCALRMKGECAAELVGAAGMLRRAAAFIDCGGREVLDIVGTGGDGSDSFNISTASAIVAAAAGVTVAKHGNRSVSSKCGAADVLKFLGYQLEAEPALVEQMIAEDGLGFLYAPKMHPILAGVAVLRRELRIRTIFNMLGPLCNPAGAQYMLLGVYSPELTELFAESLLALGIRRAMVVHGMDGLDEISCCAATRVSEVSDGRIRTYELLPELILGESFPHSDLIGGAPDYNAALLRKVIDGDDHSGRRAAVLLNAGSAIYIAGKAASISGGVALAAAAIDRGAARNQLQKLIEGSHGTRA